ncbi:MAG: hypothetical protein K5931_00300 [Lachnospiraceae bacterium]|nr:hypothetical protein [Lachnospiraceae bacterium]
MDNDIRLSVSGVLGEKGKRYIAVRFEDGKRFAEAELPSCKIKKNGGFSPEELESLEYYLKSNQNEIISKAKKINPLKAFMGYKD